MFCVSSICFAKDILGPREPEKCFADMFGTHSAHLIQTFCWHMSIILCEDVSCKSFNSQSPPYALPKSLSLTVKCSHVYRQTVRLYIWICYFRFRYMTSAIRILKFKFSLVSTFLWFMLPYYFKTK